MTTSKLAVTSFVLSIIGVLTVWFLIGFLLIPLAIVLAIIALVKNKGQTGTGLAIAAIIIGCAGFMMNFFVIGALAYYGVLDPSGFLPDRCLFHSGIGCQEITAVTQDGMHLQLWNYMGRTIYVDSITTVPTFSIICNPNLATDIRWNGEHVDFATERRTWSANQDIRLTIACENLQSGDRPAFNVTIHYLEDEESLVVRTVDGTIAATVQ